LEEEGLLDDYRFATAWVRDRINFKPRGKALLVRELIFRGIAGGIIERVLDNEFPDDENELAHRAIAPKAGMYKKLDKTTGVRRARGFLARRGFSYATANEVVSEIFGEDR
jgi:regulatory protein